MIWEVSQVKRTKEWEHNSLANVWSTTKGVAAIIAHAYENDLIDYDEKVCFEFGCNERRNCRFLSHPWQQSRDTTKNCPILEPEQLQISFLTYGWLIELILNWKS